MEEVYTLLLKTRGKTFARTDDRKGAYKRPVRVPYPLARTYFHLKWPTVA
jgi:hypothetical protein